MENDNQKEDETNENYGINKDENDFSKYNGHPFYSKFETALSIAIMQGNLGIIKLLLNHEKIDVNIDYIRKYYHISLCYEKENMMKTMLYIAVEKGDIEIVKLLLKNKNIDVNKPYIIETAEYKDKDISDIINLIDDDWSEKWPPGNPSENYYLNTCYCPKNQTKNGSCKLKIISPLHKAVEDGKVDIIKFLISNENLNINLKNRLFEISINESVWTTEGEEKTALYIAIEKYNIEIVKLLLKNPKINVNILNITYQWSDICPFKDELSVLYYAVCKNQTEIINLLLKCKNIDINIKNIIHSYAFHRIIEKRTALDCATIHKNYHIIDLLKKRSFTDF